MRRQNLRIFLFITVLVILSGVIIGYRNVDLPGESLDRGGTGPLGLVLGLDLRGGAHLVYEAERPMSIDLAFAAPIAEKKVKEGISSLGLGNTSISTFAQEEFRVEVPVGDLRKQYPKMASDNLDPFLDDLQTAIGVIRDTDVKTEARTGLSIRFGDAPNEADVTEIIKSLGYSNVTVTAVVDHIFTVADLPSIDDESEKGIREALSDSFTLEDVEISEIEGKAQAVVFFSPLPTEGDIEFALSDLGYVASGIVNLGGKDFATNVAPLDTQAIKEFKAKLQAKINGIEKITTVDTEAVIIDLTLELGSNQSQMEEALIDLGLSGYSILESRGTGYLIELSSLSEDRDENLQSQITDKLGTLNEFQLQRDNPTQERMEGVIDTIERRVNAFGIAEPSVQRFGDDRVLVQLPGVEDTRIHVVFKGGVAEASLQRSLANLGYDNAIIEDSNVVRTPGMFLINIMDLTIEENDRIQVGIEDSIGTLEHYWFDEVAGAVQLSFRSNQLRDINTITTIKSALTDLGYSEAIVSPASGTAFQVRTPTLSRDEQEELEQALSYSLGAIKTFQVTGGVEEAKSLIGQTAQLVFKERTCLNADCSEFTDRDAVGKSGEPLTGDNLTQAFAGTQPTTGLPVVNFVFDGEGTRVFRELTERIAGDRTKCIAHILDGEAIICPIAQQAIRNGAGFIEGPDFTFDKVRTLSIQLESGSLPLSLDLVRESTVDSILGDESLKSSLKAGLIGLGLIVFFMVAYYRMAGVVAAVALTVYGLIILAVFKMIPVTLTLSGLAGLILSIGMAVDANILIFERLKEELRAGRSLISAIEIGFRRAWPSIRDSNTSTFITCGILFFFGRELGEPRITGFAITLAIGVGVSMFTALMVSKTFLQLLAFTGVGKARRLFSPEGASRSSTTLRRGG